MVVVPEAIHRWLCRVFFHQVPQDAYAGGVVDVGQGDFDLGRNGVGGGLGRQDRGEGGGRERREARQGIILRDIRKMRTIRRNMLEIGRASCRERV